MDNSSKIQSYDRFENQQINELSIRDYLIILRLHYQKIIFFIIICYVVAISTS